MVRSQQIKKFARDLKSGKRVAMTPFHPKTNSDFALEWLKVLLLALITAAVYSNTLNCEFAFDDIATIFQEQIRWNSLELGNLVDVWQNSFLTTRPVANLSFALNYFFHQYNVAGYHLVNIAIHISTGVFLFFLIKTTLGLPALRLHRYSLNWLPFLSTLLWLVHPLQTQSVTYIVQRMNSMAAMFYVMALFVYVKGRLARNRQLKIVFFGVAGVAGLLAVGSKEIALTLPFFVVLYEWYFLQDLELGQFKKYGLWAGGLICLLVLAAFLFYLGNDPLGSLLAGYGGRDFTLGERLLTESRVVIFYLSLLLLPLSSRLNLDHDFVISQSLLAPSNTILSLIALLCLLALAVAFARRQRLLSFGILWFLGNLAIESTVVPLEIVFEHRLYLPSMMLILALMACAGEYLADSRLARVVGLVLIMVLAFCSYQRNQIWESEVTLWRDCVEKSPEKARTHNNIAVALKYAGLSAVEEEYHLLQAIRLDQSFAEAYNNLGNIRFLQGNFAEAISLYFKAIELDPNVAGWHFNLGDTLVKAWRLQEGKDHFEIALDLSPGHVDARQGLKRVNLMIARNKSKELAQGTR